MSDNIKAMALWIRPSGNKIETIDNVATVAYAKSQGWKRQKVEAIETQKAIPNDDSKNNRTKQPKVVQRKL